MLIHYFVFNGFPERRLIYDGCSYYPWRLLWWHFTLWLELGNTRCTIKTSKLINIEIIGSVIIFLLISLEYWNSKRFQDTCLLFGEPKLQNMIFKAHKNKAKSKRWALYLENWASYDTFRVATWGENLYQTRFSNLKISVSFWDLGPIFCKWAQFLVRSNFYIATWGLTQLLHWFLRGGWFSPPPSNPQNLDPLPGRFKNL